MFRDIVMIKRDLSFLNHEFRAKVFKCKRRVDKTAVRLTP